MVEQVHSQDSRQEEDVTSSVVEECSNLEPGSQHNDYATQHVASSPIIFEGRSRTSSMSPIIAGHNDMRQDVLQPQSHPDHGSSFDDLANALKTQCNQDRDMIELADLDTCNFMRHWVRQQRILLIMQRLVTRPNFFPKDTTTEKVKQFYNQPVNKH
jgi:hypothetical protein